MQYIEPGFVLLAFFLIGIVVGYATFLIFRISIQQSRFNWSGALAVISTLPGGGFLTYLSEPRNFAAYGIGFFAGFAVYWRFLQGSKFITGSQAGSRIGDFEDEASVRSRPGKRLDLGSQAVSRTVNTVACDSETYLEVAEETEGRHMAIDHIRFAVSSYEQSKSFFTQALSPLGVQLLMEDNDSGWLGKGGTPAVWFGSKALLQNPTHVALVAETRAEVDAFYVAAIQAGAKDNGPPGTRDIFHPNYYSALVIDPDGHSIEAVCYQLADGQRP